MNPKRKRLLVVRYPPGKSITSFAAYATDVNCTLCKNEKHPLYVCTRFKPLPRDKMVSLIKTSELCLRPEHFSRQCPSLNRCKKCQKPHHTLIHSQNKEDNLSQSDKGSQSTAETSNTAAGIVFNSLLMTY